MFGKAQMLAAAAVVAGVLLPAQAMAAFEAHTRVDLNLRVGPATDYGVIDVIPAGDPVTVIGCLDGYDWCDVDWIGLRGWVAARYLVEPGTTVYLPQWAPRIGLPVISFSFHVYHDRHYRDRPWHRERTGRWRGREHVRTERRRERPRAERPRQRQESERPRQRQQAERPRRQREVQRERPPRAEQRQRRQQSERPGRSQRALQPPRRGSGAERQGRGRGAERQGRGRGGERRERRRGRN